MATIRLIKDGREFPLPHSMLKNMASACPDGPLGRELGRALLELGIPSVTEELLHKDFLAVEDRDAIWAVGDIDLRRRLLGFRDFLSQLTDAQAREIMEQDDAGMLQAVGEWCEYLYPGRDGGIRISGAAADRLMEHIRSHENAEVRGALAKNYYTPPRFNLPLAEYISNGYDMRGYPFAGLSVEEVALFKGRSRDMLETLAYHVHDIEDRETRKAAVTLLATHPDPEVRLALAENDDAPRLAFELLAADADPEIAALAAEKLEND